MVAGSDSKLLNFLVTNGIGIAVVVLGVTELQRTSLESYRAHSPKVLSRQESEQLVRAFHGQFIYPKPHDKQIDPAEREAAFGGSRKAQGGNMLGRAVDRIARFIGL